MNDEDRRSLLRQLTDSEYRDVLSVCAMMPNVEITARCEGVNFTYLLDYHIHHICCHQFNALYSLGQRQ